MDELSVYIMIVLKTSIGMAIVLIYVSFINRRYITQASSIDLMGNFLLGAVIGGAIYAENMSLAKHTIIIIMIIFILSLMNFIIRKVKGLNRLFFGYSIQLVKNKKLMIDDFKNNESQISFFEFLNMVARQKITSLRDISNAKLEADGSVTILTEGNFPNILMIEGRFIEENLEEYGGKNKLLNELSKLNIKNTEEIFLIESSVKGILVVTKNGNFIY
jgi:uncharacterized membrane protein YcaP (DUF421 family)